MEEITENKLYTFVRLLKEGKQFIGISSNKVKHWKELIDIILNGKFDKTFNKMSNENKKDKINVIITTYKIEDFLDGIKKLRIKSKRIIYTEKINDKEIEVWETKKIFDEDDEE